MHPKRYMTTAEAAIRLGLSERRIRVLCREDRLGERIGRNYAITEAQLAAFAAEPRNAGRPPRKGKR